MGPIATPLELETQETNMETSDGPQKIFGVSGVPGFTQRPIDFSSFSWQENRLFSAGFLDKKISWFSRIENQLISAFFLARKLIDFSFLSWLENQLISASILG